MEPKQQNKVIADFCGWEPSKEIDGCWRRKSDGLTQTCIPNFVNDLNAISDAEDYLSEELVMLYDNNLAVICLENFIWSATAAQRSEAFLKTIGKWKD